MSYASVSFADDADLATDGKNVVVNMQLMSNLCNTLYKAAGGKMQEEKSFFFAEMRIKSRLEMPEKHRYRVQSK